MFPSQNLLGTCMYVLGHRISRTCRSTNNSNTKMSAAAARDSVWHNSITLSLNRTMSASFVQLQLPYTVGLHTRAVSYRTHFSSDFSLRVFSIWDQVETTRENSKLRRSSFTSEPLRCRRLRRRHLEFL